MMHNDTLCIINDAQCITMRPCWQSSTKMQAFLAFFVWNLACNKNNTNVIYWKIGYSVFLVGYDGGMDFKNRNLQHQ